MLVSLQRELPPKGNAAAFNSIGILSTQSESRMLILLDDILMHVVPYYVNTVKFCAVCYDVCAVVWLQ